MKLEAVTHLPDERINHKSGGVVYAGSNVLVKRKVDETYLRHDKNVNYKPSDVIE